jgi:hypothetical protein
MFQRAQRKKAKLRLAFCGTSGSGKTYSALLVGQGLGGPIAMIDTEQGSGELYADLTDYDVARLTPPFSPQKYIQAIQAAEKAGYNVLIIDSLSHAWAGQGGILEEVDKRKSSQKNQFTAWRDVTPMHNALVDTILQSPVHIIVTMRSKTAYELQKNDKGNLEPVKIGLAPIQRDGMEYEFTAVLDIDAAKHVATSSKDRTGLFDGQYFVPSIETGQQLKTWLEQGTESPTAQAQQPAETPQAQEPKHQSKPQGNQPKPVSDAQVKKINTLAGKLGLSREDKISRINSWLGKAVDPQRQIQSTKELTGQEATKLIEQLEAQAPKDQPKEPEIPDEMDDCPF